MKPHLPQNAISHTPSCMQNAFQEKTAFHIRRNRIITLIIIPISHISYFCFLILVSSMMYFPIAIQSIFNVYLYLFYSKNNNYAL